MTFAAARMVLVATAWLAVAGGASLATAQTSTGDQVKGRLLYQDWCAGCHDRGAGHPGTQSLEIKYRGTAVPAALEERTDLSPQVTAIFVRRGIALMPPFRKTEISDADLQDLAAYLAKGK